MHVTLRQLRLELQTLSSPISHRPCDLTGLCNRSPMTEMSRLQGASLIYSPRTEITSSKRDTAEEETSAGVQTQSCLRLSGRRRRQTHGTGSAPLCPAARTQTKTSQSLQPSVREVTRRRPLCLPCFPVMLPSETKTQEEPEASSLQNKPPNTDEAGLKPRTMAVSVGEAARLRNSELLI